MKIILLKREIFRMKFKLRLMRNSSQKVTKGCNVKRVFVGRILPILRAVCISIRLFLLY